MFTLGHESFSHREKVFSLWLCGNSLFPVTVFQAHLPFRQPPGQAW